MSDALAAVGGGLIRANELVSAYAKSRGAKDAKLDAANRCALGEVSFRYDSAADVLTGRISLGKAFRAEADSQSKANVRKVVQALNDPAQLQGTFELAGGRIELDEAGRWLYLVKDFPVRGTAGAVLRREMDDLLDLGAKWRLRWLAWAGSIVHGHVGTPGAPLPVNRANDHLHSEFRR